MKREIDVDADYDDMVEREDRELGLIAQRARELALGTLSEDEAAIAGCSSFGSRSIENITCRLYYHLTAARSRRLAMEAMTAWCQDYVVAHRERENALAWAHRHWRRLIDLRAPIDALLAQMILSEGLTP